MLQEKNVIRTFNVGLIVTMFLLFALGIVTLYSATNGPGLRAIYKAQLIYFAVGVVICLALVFFDLQMLEKLSYFFYALALGLLCLVLVVGKIGGGAQRWIPIGPVHLQPSEFAKLALVFTLAKYFRDDKEDPPYTLRRLVVPALLVVPYFILIVIQPDLGTAGIIVLVATSLVLFLKVRWQSLAIVALIGAVSVPIAYKFVLHDYQRDRLKTFLDPGRDVRGSGYNALQCRIAVGSGQVFGKGYLKGTQAQLNFIPEQHTDFIFSVFAEERGFVGCMILLLLYGFYLFYALRTAARARDKFEMLLALGLTSIVFWHVFVNIGMVSGVLPIVGVGLPFFSKGGSALWTFMISTALLLNIGRKRYIF